MSTTEWVALGGFAAIVIVLGAAAFFGGPGDDE